LAYGSQQCRQTQEWLTHRGASTCAPHRNMFPSLSSIFTRELLNTNRIIEPGSRQTSFRLFTIHVMGKGFMGKLIFCLKLVLKKKFSPRQNGTVGIMQTSPFIHTSPLYISVTPYSFTPYAEKSFIKRHILEI